MEYHQSFAEWSSRFWPLFANHLWQATIFSIGLILLANLMRRGKAGVRYIIRLMASLKFVLPSMLLAAALNQAGIDLSAFRSSAPMESPSVSEIVPVVLQVAAPVEETASFEYAELSAAHNELYCALTAVWLIGSLTTFFIWMRRRSLFYGLLKAGRIVLAGREAESLKRARERLRVQRRIQIVVSDLIEEPGVWGVFRPVLALPEGMTEHLSDAELDAVLMHELAHVKRWDNLVGNLHMMLCCALWFHPLVWRLDRRLLDDREEACDETAIDLTGDSRIYAAGILKVCRFRLKWNLAGVSGASGSNIRRRMERIMSHNGDGKSALLHRALTAFAAMALILFSIAAGVFNRGAAAAQSAATAPKPSTATIERNDWNVEEMQLKVDQTAYTPINFENEDDAPVVIIDAKIKIVPIDGGSEELLTPPQLTLVNKTDRRVKYLRVSFKSESAFRDEVGFKVNIEARGTYTFQPDWRKWNNRVAAGNGVAAFAKVTTVKFDDGTVWGRLDAFLPQPPQPPVQPLQPLAQPPQPLAQPPQPLAQPPQPPVQPPQPPAQPPQPPAAIAPLDPVAPAVVWASPSTPLPSAPPQPRAAPSAPAIRVLPALPDLPSMPKPATTPALRAPRAYSPLPALAAERPLFAAQTPLAVLAYPDGSKDDDDDADFNTEIAANYSNLVAAPLIVTEAKVSINAAGTKMKKPVIKLLNTTDKRAVSIKVRIKPGSNVHAVTSTRIVIEPHSSYVLQPNIKLSTEKISPIRVQIIGVVFEDGSIWGDMNSTINSRDVEIQVNPTIRKVQ